MNWLYLFPELGVTINHDNGRVFYLANLGVQFQFDLRRPDKKAHGRDSRQ
ncbi:MAG: hypothetical protein P9M14_07895 [Candidatus Alcyoniella australis]|nr:hypothetical protein [Candidatus Alcyoniella australis]